jgi:hypothetical protein
MLWVAVSPDAAFADKSTPTGASVWRYLESGHSFGGSGLVREEVCICSG